MIFHALNIHNRTSILDFRQYLKLQKMAKAAPRLPIEYCLVSQAGVVEVQIDRGSKKSTAPLVRITKVSEDRNSDCVRL